MTTPRQYATANSLRVALETRLLERSRRDDSDIQRLRRQVAFDRLLSRMFEPSQQMRDGWILKGGYALELRFRVVGEDWLGFAGVEAVTVPALSAEQHWAEKLHAYTRPRGGRTNTRVKDLIDLILLIERETLAADRILAAVDATFGRRRTHEIPSELPAPPAEWERPFAHMAEECQLEHTPANAYAAVSKFWAGLQPTVGVA